MQTFVDVIMPLPLAATFTYSVPDDLASQVARGSRVIVPFGRKKIYTAIVENVHFSDSLLSLSYFVSERMDEKAARDVRTDKQA